MENAPKNIRYLQLTACALLVMASILLYLAYNYAAIVPYKEILSIWPGVGLLVLSLLAFINAYFTFQFSTNIDAEHFDKWQLVQHRFWLGTTIVTLPFVFLLLWLAVINVFFISKSFTY